MYYGFHDEIKTEAAVFERTTKSFNTDFWGDEKLKAFENTLWRDEFDAIFGGIMKKGPFAEPYEQYTCEQTYKAFMLGEISLETQAKLAAEINEKFMLKSPIEQFTVSRIIKHFRAVFQAELAKNNISLPVIKKIRRPRKIDENT